ncbi:MAG TPA: hypothetical protein VEB63_11640 [Chitinophagaceae bacterium]|nr:hypothetical protein [Chitinophagaceae bacterium]
MSRLRLFFLASCFFISVRAAAQSGPATLDVVGWNIEWFGSPSNGPANDDLQENNVRSILAWLDADLYGLVEVVDTMRLRRVVDFLGSGEYGFIIAPYCSGNTTGTGNGWLTGQKQAFIYRKSVFSNVSARGLMRNSANSYTNWASGRFPFLFSATATVNGATRNVNFILLHAKAGSTQDDYIRRAAAAIELKDTLDAFFSSSNVWIIGDYNDALHNSIYTGASVSPYHSIVSDSTDADHYKSITLPLALAGQSSMINFPNVIDNHIFSNEVSQYYISNSARIRNDVTSVVPDYVSAHNTSDHYPVFSNYNLSGVITGLPPLNASEFGVVLFPNPGSGSAYLRFTKPHRQLRIQLHGADGRLIYRRVLSSVSPGILPLDDLPALPKGNYFLELAAPGRRTVLQLAVL